jgi:hypothetical protein
VDSLKPEEGLEGDSVLASARGDEEAQDDVIGIHLPGVGHLPPQGPSQGRLGFLGGAGEGGAP